MARKATKNPNSIDAKAFLEALDELEKAKGVSKESILENLKESLEKAYVKFLKGGDDAVVRATLDLENGISICQIKTVVEDVQDDYLEVGIDEIDNPNGQYKVGDEYPVYANLSELNQLFMASTRSVLKQKINEAEKAVLYDIYKDKIGEMIVGTVERCDERQCVVNIGKATVNLTRREMIGDETFKVGQQIKLYVSDVSTSGKGFITVTRSDEGFLKRLFEEEIREIEDGTILIKNIVRRAGIRSKVAVISTDPDVNANGACIGKEGSRILRISNQLGNSKDRELIDIINYNENQALYIIDAFRPAKVVGIKLNIEEPGQKRKALVIVEDGKLLLAMGKKAANFSLASKLTGWDILLKEKTSAEDENVKYYTPEECITVYAPVAAKPVVTVKPVETITEEVALTVETKVEEPVITETPVETKVEEPVVTETPVVEEKPVEPEVKVVIKTTTTLESLEQQLEKEKERANKQQGKTRRPRKITNDEVQEEKTVIDEKEVAKKKETYMDIYTEEELRQMEEEEIDNSYDDYSDDEIDYDEYDSYYDEDR